MKDDMKSILYPLPNKLKTKKDTRTFGFYFSSIKFCLIYCKIQSKFDTYKELTLSKEKLPINYKSYWYYFFYKHLLEVAP